MPLEPAGRPAVVNDDLVNAIDGQSLHWINMGDGHQLGSPWGFEASNSSYAAMR